MRRVHVLSSGAQGFSAKLAPKYEGPYKMVERKSTTVYVLEMRDGRKNPKVHIEEVKKYVVPQGLKESGKKQEGDSDDGYYVLQCCHTNICVIESSSKSLVEHVHLVKYLIVESSSIN